MGTAINGINPGMPFNNLLNDVRDLLAGFPKNPAKMGANFHIEMAYNLILCYCMATKSSIGSISCSLMSKLMQEHPKLARPIVLLARALYSTYHAIDAEQLAKSVDSSPLDVYPLLDGDVSLERMIDSRTSSKAADEIAQLGDFSQIVRRISENDDVMHHLIYKPRALDILRRANMPNAAIHEISSFLNVAGVTVADSDLAKLERDLDDMDPVLPDGIPPEWIEIALVAELENPRPISATMWERVLHLCKILSAAPKTCENVLIKLVSAGIRNGSLVIALICGRHSATPTVSREMVTLSQTAISHWDSKNTASFPTYSQWFQATFGRNFKHTPLLIASLISLIPSEAVDMLQLHIRLLHRIGIDKDYVDLAKAQMTRPYDFDELGIPRMHSPIANLDPNILMRVDAAQVIANTPILCAFGIILHLIRSQHDLTDQLMTVMTAVNSPLFATLITECLAIAACRHPRPPFASYLKPLIPMVSWAHLLPSSPTASFDVTMQLSDNIVENVRRHVYQCSPTLTVNLIKQHVSELEHMVLIRTIDSGASDMRKWWIQTSDNYTIRHVLSDIY